MVRKVFWILWVTVWPALALYPHLVTAQGPGRKQAVVVAQATVTLDASEVTDMATEPGIESATEVPSQTVSQPQAVPGQLERLPEIVDTEKSTVTKPADNDPFADPATAETLPTARAGKAISRSAVATTRPTHKIGPELSAQEEKARALIYERAVQRGLQRQTRLDVKYRSKSIQGTTAFATRWQPHLTETNWVAGLRKSARP